jgi:hypothetical protein
MHKLFQFLASCTVVCSGFFTGASAAQCKPVAYLFRHAEDLDKADVIKVKTHPFDVTLTASGNAHAALYIQMMGNFQQGRCPIKAVYALNPFLPPNGDWGTSNPYWTAQPLAQVSQTTPDQPTQNTNPIITVQVSSETDPLMLTEYLNNGEKDQFVADIKAALNDQQSVAIFWTSQGMCTVATALGLPGLPNYNCGQCDPLPDCASKPPRNSVFQFSYDVLEQTFTGVTEYAQCFNYDATNDKFTDQSYCQFSSNLKTWEGPDHPKFSKKLNKLSGRICAKDSPPSTCTPP